MRLHAEVVSDYNATYYNQYTDGMRYLLKLRLSEVGGMVASREFSGHDTINGALVAAQKSANLRHVEVCEVTLPNGSTQSLW